MARARGGPVSISYPSTRFHVDPSPEQIRQDILLLQKKMGDYTLPLQYSKQIIIGDVKLAFLSEKDPKGPKWAALSDRAELVPRIGILRRLQTNARMYRSLINRFNWGVSNEGVYLNQARIPEYFPYHQQDDSGAGGDGVLRINREKFRLDKAKVFARLKKTRIFEGTPNRGALLEEESARRVAAQYHKEHEDKKVELASVGEGKIPRRRMIGPSQSAEGKIVDTFDAWAKDVIIIYKRGGPHGVVVMAPRRGVKL